MFPVGYYQTLGTMDEPPNPYPLILTPNPYP
jgi:hypothetical protein